MGIVEEPDSFLMTCKLKLVFYSIVMYMGIENILKSNDIHLLQLPGHVWELWRSQMKMNSGTVQNVNPVRNTARSRLNGEGRRKNLSG